MRGSEDARIRHLLGTGETRTRQQSPWPGKLRPGPQPRPAAPERPAPAETAPMGLRRGRGGQQGAGPGAGPGWGLAGRSSEACVDWARLPVAVPACAGGRGHSVRKAEFLKECACVYGHRRRTKSTRVVDMIVCSIGGGPVPNFSILPHRRCVLRRPQRVRVRSGHYALRPYRSRSPFSRSAPAGLVPPPAPAPR